MGSVWDKCIDNKVTSLADWSASNQKKNPNNQEVK